MRPCDACCERDGSGTLQADHDVAVSARPVPGSPSPVWIDSVGWGYLDVGGNIAPVLTFDNGPDPFVEGFARFREDGKTGFIDADLKVRIAATYQFASAFEGGTVRIGTQCREQRMGAHTTTPCSRWARLDHSGAVLSDH